MLRSFLQMDLRSSKNSFEQLKQVVLRQHSRQARKSMSIAQAVV